MLGSESFKLRGVSIITFNRTSSARHIGFGSQSDDQRRENGALAAAVTSDDEIDILVQLDLQRVVAHEILDEDSFDSSGRRLRTCIAQQTFKQRLKPQTNMEGSGVYLL